MELDRCLAVLERRGLVVVSNGVPDHWLVYQVDNPYEIENGGWPDTFKTVDLIEMVEAYLLALPEGDCPFHPYLSVRAREELDLSSSVTEQTTMQHAYDAQDPTKAVVDVGDWLIKKPKGPPMCPVCHQSMHLYGANSPSTKARFDHDNGNTCLAPARTPPFSQLAVTPRDPRNAAAARSFVFDHLNLIYDTCRRMCPGLLWSEFLPLLDEANKNRIWDLKNFDPALSPFLLLCGAASFDISKTRKTSIHFALEPNTHAPGYWTNLPHPTKRYL